MLIDWKMFRRLSFIFIFIIIISFFISCIVHPSVSDFLNLADSKNNLGVTSSKTTKCIQYIVNNGLKVPLQMFLLSLIPIPFFYFMPMVLTAIATGVVLYLPFNNELKGKLSFSDILLGMLPHMIIEIFGFLIVASGVYCINRIIRSKLYKNTTANISLVEAIKKLAIMYFLIALPLIVIAAFIEAFVTPLLS